jgi:hypothetical protein
MKRKEEKRDEDAEEIVFRDRLQMVLCQTSQSDFYVVCSCPCLYIVMRYIIIALLNNPPFSL